MHPVWIGNIQELLGTLRTAVGIEDPTIQETQTLKKIRRLMGRLQEMTVLASEDDYWFTTLSPFLERIVELLCLVEEFWAPILVREMSAVIKGLNKA
jgi:hypothetical protein